MVESGDAKANAPIDVDAVAVDPALTPKDRAKKIAAALGISTKDAYERVQRATTRFDDKLGRARALLAEAAHALMDADVAARREHGDPSSASSAPSAPSASSAPPPVESDIPGADILLELLARRPALRAPVETHEAAKALLSALSALDALDDALAMEAEGRMHAKRGRD